MILFLFLVNILALIFAGVFWGLQFFLPWLPWGVLVAVSGVLALPVLVVVFVLGVILVQSKESYPREKASFFPPLEAVFKLKK